MIPRWLRKLGVFLPNYGEYGGYSATYTGPVDKMDALFKVHDEALAKAKQLKCPKVRKNAKNTADKDLATGLRTDLKPYKHKIYGPVFRWFASLVFRP